MTVGGEKVTHSPVKLVKITKTKQKPLKASGNGSKDKQQLKKLIFKTIYEDSVGKARVYGI